MKVSYEENLANCFGLQRRGDLQIEIVLIGQRQVLWGNVADYREFVCSRDLILSGLIPSRASFTRRFLR